ncbi:MAG: prephenate dehydrogenase/arogenate dehydrogenase family protein [Thermoleophilia bacterium]|nr:prephenate dehydrogenase/arogenate dehydrogenase family protein [Thermoleophilia bacterium]
MAMTGTGGPVALVGVGLIGGSLGLALRALSGAPEVRGIDPSAGVLDAALACGAISVASPDLASAVRGAEVVVVCAPVGEIPGLVREVLRFADANAVVTDVGSAKSGVVRALRPGERERFCGGHPVAGGEGAGVGQARGDLFRGTTWFLTPTVETRPDLLTRVHGVVTAVGAHPVAVDAAVHDHLMALVSHLPHVIASTLIRQAATTAPKGREALRSAGPSFRDLTRVAGANPALWADILLENRDAVVVETRRHRAELAEVERALDLGDREWLEGFFRSAADGRARLMAEDDPVTGEVARVVVEIPNEPGVLSAIATALGHAHINIEDLHLIPARPGEPLGSLELDVHGPDAARRAIELITERGFRVRGDAGDAVPH